MAKDAEQQFLRLCWLMRNHRCCLEQCHPAGVVPGNFFPHRELSKPETATPQSPQRTGVAFHSRALSRSARGDNLVPREALGNLQGAVFQLPPWLVGQGWGEAELLEWEREGCGRKLTLENYCVLGPTIGAWEVRAPTLPLHPHTCSPTHLCTSLSHSSSEFRQKSRASAGSSEMESKEEMREYSACIIRPG